MRPIAIVLPLALLSGCGAEPIPSNNIDKITPAEAEALNDAAAMLDQTEPPPRLTDGEAEIPPVPVK